MFEEQKRNPMINFTGFMVVVLFIASGVVSYLSIGMFHMTDSWFFVGTATLGFVGMVAMIMAAFTYKYIKPFK